MQVAIVLFLAAFATTTVPTAPCLRPSACSAAKVGLGEFEVGAIFASSGVLFFLTASFWG